MQALVARAPAQFNLLHESLLEVWLGGDSARLRTPARTRPRGRRKSSSRRSISLQEGPWKLPKRRPERGCGGLTGVEAERGGPPPCACSLTDVPQSLCSRSPVRQAALSEFCVERVGGLADPRTWLVRTRRRPASPCADPAPKPRRRLFLRAPHGCGARPRHAALPALGDRHWRSKQRA